ncbi:MAG: hypothetical protein M5R41_07445 [Bacteroidia bacterium]|nr:hypothetical protein [Bacteroidia bacterium]
MKCIAIIIVILAVYSTAARAQWAPGEPITDARDGQVYRTVVIGTQVWMAENLNIGTYVPSSRFGSLMRDNNVVEKYCWENSAANCDGEGGVLKRGGMYEWEEAVQQWSGPVVLPVRGICPEGWHVPSNNEWRILTLHLGGAAAYIAMIEGGSSGFDALFTGYRDEMSGKFSPGYATDEARASFWAADPASGDRTQIVQVGPSEIRVLPVARPNGICVRCIYDGPATSVGDVALPTDLRLHNTAVRSGRTVLMHFSANAGDVDIVISDLLGRTVHQSRIHALHGENYHVVDLSACAAGPYLMLLRNSSGSVMEMLRVM